MRGPTIETLGAGIGSSHPPGNLFPSSGFGLNGSGPLAIFGRIGLRNATQNRRLEAAMTRTDDRTPLRPYPAEKARGGEIILRTPLRRAIFIGGLAGAVVLALLLAIAQHQ